MSLILILDTKNRTDKSVNVYDRDSKKRLLKITLMKSSEQGRTHLAFDGEAIVVRESICDEDIAPDTISRFGQDEETK